MGVRFLRLMAVRIAGDAGGVQEDFRIAAFEADVPTVATTKVELLAETVPEPYR